MKFPRSTLPVCLFLMLASRLAAQVPVAVLRPVQAREKIVDLAVAYIGKPYRYGGNDPSGFDCSGFVFYVYRQAVGAKPPRTVREQWDFVEVIPKDSLQEGDLVFFRNEGVIDHVGIYIGGNLFVHAASDRLIPAVIKTSLKEMYWASRFAGAGRVVTASGDLGITVPVSAAIVLSNGSGIRGVEVGAGLVLPLFGGEIGVELRAEYDAMLGVTRVPALVTLSPDKRLKVFAGPALCFGTPILREGGSEREYEAAGGFLGVVGISWKPVSFKVGKLRLGFVGEIAYEGYLDVSGLAPDGLADAAARLRIGFGVEIR